MTGHLIAIEDKSIWIFCNASQSLYVVVFRVQTKYISFFHVSVLLILFTFDHSAFRPIARLLIVLSLCGHFQAGYVSRLPLPVPSQHDHVVNGLKLSWLSRHECFRVTPAKVSVRQSWKASGGDAPTGASWSGDLTLGRNGGYLYGNSTG